MLSNWLREHPQPERRRLIVYDEAFLTSQYDVVSGVEPRHRSLKVMRYIWLHAILLMLLFGVVLLLPFPFFCMYNRCLLHTYTIQVLMHVAMWLVSVIVHSILQRLHYDSYIGGYAEFYHKTWFHRKFPLVVYTAGNTLLLVLSVTFRELDADNSGVGGGVSPDGWTHGGAWSYAPVQWPLSALNYVQLLCGVEVLFLLPVLITYLREVMRFNGARLPPDVAVDDIDVRPPPASDTDDHVGFDVGWRDRRRRRHSSQQQQNRRYHRRGHELHGCWRRLQYARAVLRRQADTMSSLHAHNRLLGARVMQLHEQLTACNQRQAAGGSDASESTVGVDV